MRKSRADLFRLLLENFLSSEINEKKLDEVAPLMTETPLTSLPNLQKKILKKVLKK